MLPDLPGLGRLAVGPSLCAPFTRWSMSVSLLPALPLEFTFMKSFRILFQKSLLPKQCLGCLAWCFLLKTCMINFEVFWGCANLFCLYYRSLLISPVNCGVLGTCKVNFWSFFFTWEDFLAKLPYLFFCSQKTTTSTQNYFWQQWSWVIYQMPAPSNFYSTFFLAHQRIGQASVIAHLLLSLCISFKHHNL